MSDQRLQFECMPSQPIFETTVDYTTAAYGSIFPSAEDFLPLDTDDVDFSPTPDGELIGGCRKCGIDYGSCTELKLHFGAVHSRQSFECCICNKLFIRRHGFLLHIKRFHEDVTSRSHPCPFCEQIYTSTDALNLHVSLHHKDPQLICPLCSHQIPEGGMKSHVEKEHQSQTYSIDVSNCEPPPTSTNKLRLPTREKIHQCTQCAYETNRAERLRVHIEGVHENQRHYPCSMCSQSFKQKDKLSRHVNSVHLQQKNYACDYGCGMVFARKDEQLRHVRIVHMGTKVKTISSVSKPSVKEERRHQCHLCSYWCERSDKLKIHMTNVHSEDRPFACNFCEKTFKLRDKLNLHVNTVHLRKKPFYCDSCGQAFGRKDAAKRHQKRWCVALRRKEEDCT